MIVDNVDVAQEYTEAELAKLSDEERAAIAAGSDDEEKLHGELVEVPDIKAEKPDTAIKEPDPDTVVDQITGADDKDAFIPRYTAQVDGDYDTKMDALATKFEDGELTLPEYVKQSNDLVREKTKSEIASEHSNQAATQRWEWEITRFMEDHADYSKDPMLWAALDAAISIENGIKENASKSDAAILRMAHARVMEKFGDKVEVKPDVKPVARAKPNLAAVPKTLANLPSAELSDTGQDEFAYLDKLEGMDYEKALVKLTDSQKEKYLKAG